MSASQVTSRTNLQFLKNQAKRLLKTSRSGKPESCSRIRAALPKFADTPDEDFQDAAIALAEALAVIAIEHGFSSWAKLKHEIDSMSQGMAEALGSQSAQSLAAVLRSNASLLRCTRDSLELKARFLEQVSAVFQRRATKFVGEVVEVLSQLSPGSDEARRDVHDLRLSIGDFERVSRQVLSLDTARHARLRRVVDALDSDGASGMDVMFGEDPETVSEVREALSSSDNLRSSMTREVRAPLLTVHTAFRLILAREGGVLTEPPRQNLRRLLADSDQMLTMINDLFDLARVGTDRMQVTVEECDVSEIVDQVIDAVSKSVTTGVMLDRDVPGDIGNLSTDGRRLRQALYNLVSTAVKFTDSGSVTLAARRDSERLVLSVSDTGPGVPTDVDLFDRRWREQDASDNDKSIGLGLGLSLTRRIVDMLGGSIDVESEVGKGSTFTIRVPSVYPG